MSPLRKEAPIYSRERKPNGRKMHERTALARAIRASGRPAWLIGAEAGLTAAQVYSYAAGSKPLKGVHLTRLCIALGMEPDQLRELPVR